MGIIHNYGMLSLLSAVKHEARCSVCNTFPIIGIRYALQLYFRRPCVEKPNMLQVPMFEV